MEQSSNLEPRFSNQSIRRGPLRLAPLSIYTFYFDKRLNISWSMSIPENITADWRRSDKQAMWLPLRLFIACLVYLKLFNRVALLLETAKAHDKNGMLYKIRPWQYRTGLASNPLKDCLSLIKDNMGNETPLTTSDGIKWAPSSESIPLKFHMETSLSISTNFLIHSFFLNSQ